MIQAKHQMIQGESPYTQINLFAIEIVLLTKSLFHIHALERVMMGLAALVETVAHFFIEAHGIHATRNAGLLDASLAHPLFGLGDNSLAQMFAAVFRQYHNTPDFGNAFSSIAYLEPAASSHRVNTVQRQNVMAVFAIMGIDFGIERNLVLVHHRCHAHVVDASALTFS